MHDSLSDNSKNMLIVNGTEMKTGNEMKCFAECSKLWAMMMVIFGVHSRLIVDDMVNLTPSHTFLSLLRGFWHVAASL